MADYQTGGWISSGTRLEAAEKEMSVYTCRELKQDLSVVRPGDQSLYQLSYRY